MSANLDVIFRSMIPPEMQGRVYACRNTLQFFTIPIGFFLGGLMADKVCESFMAAPPEWSAALFGTGKGSGAALMMFLLGIAGTSVCLVFGRVLRGYRFQDGIE